MKRKVSILIFYLVACVSLAVGCNTHSKTNTVNTNIPKTNSIEKQNDNNYNTNSITSTCNLDIPKIEFTKDKDNDGINDLDDILEELKILYPFFKNTLKLLPMKLFLITLII